MIVSCNQVDRKKTDFHAQLRELTCDRCICTNTPGSKTRAICKTNERNRESPLSGWSSSLQSIIKEFNKRIGDHIFIKAMKHTVIITNHPSLRGCLMLSNQNVSNNARLWPAVPTFYNYLQIGSSTSWMPTLWSFFFLLLLLFKGSVGEVNCLKREKNARPTRTRTWYPACHEHARFSLVP